MFPDPMIAESYTQGEPMFKHAIEYDISPYFRASMLHDFLNQPFTFKYDESTKSQIKKQYDGYVQFWSPNICQIVNKYCGSPFVGHCTSEQLFDHFLEFSKETGCHPALLMQKHLEQTTGERLWNVDTCTLHMGHTFFQKGVPVLQIDIDQCAVDLSGFFKLSAVRHEDYVKMGELKLLQNMSFAIHLLDG